MDSLHYSDYLCYGGRSYSQVVQDLRKGQRTHYQTSEDDNQLKLLRVLHNGGEIKTYKEGINEQ